MFSSSFGDLLLLGCFNVCVAFRIGFCSVSAISRLSAHASFDLHLSLNSVRGFRGGRGGGGRMTSMRLRLVFSFSFGDHLLLGRGAVCRNRFGGHFRILVLRPSTHLPCNNLEFLQLSRQELRN